jgi:hypothetical protein
MLETSESVYQCAVSCNNDETCVAFDYETSTGYCYAYKEDPAAPYVGSGNDSDWSCYTHMSMPAECDPIYQSTVDEVANIRILAYNQYITNVNL